MKMKYLYLNKSQNVHREISEQEALDILEPYYSSETIKSAKPSYTFVTPNAYILTLI